MSAQRDTSLTRRCCEQGARCLGLYMCKCSYVCVSVCGRGGFDLEGVVENLNEDLGKGLLL